MLRFGHYYPNSPTRHFRSRTLAFRGIFVTFRSFLPESPRLLLTKDEIPKFKKVMRKIAAKNSSVITSVFEDLVLKAQEEEKKKVPFSQILKSFVLAKHLILLSLLFSLYLIIFSAINFNLHNMTGNIFINYFILTIFDIPGNIIGNWASDYLGRRMSSVLFEILSAICFIIPIIFINNEWIVVVFCAIAKMFGGAMMLAVYKQVGELFPTSLRATAYGVTGVVGMAASIVAPSITALGQKNPAIPYYFVCGFSIIGAILCSFLPETLGLPYPQTMREAISIGKNQPYFSIIYKGNVHKKLHQTKPKKVRTLDVSEIKA
ncbi:Solute carrier family 22 member 21 [Armadillidium nasatum]|uniref:Solute carrier family 22 member 21 n=1 Tax=Armadillidium nasatum TaxID=96803 RepID=A0A5N5TEC0_9CRUS|nr:Solute carrier family 22 member 21 [Armadillidium nasatum]